MTFPVAVSAESKFDGQNEQLFSPFQISGGISFNALEHSLKESKSLGYEAMLGYRFNDSILFEGGLAHYHFKQENVNPLLLRFKTLIPVSNYASIYVGGGAAYNKKTYPLLNLGVHYRINNNWYADVGYQGSFGIDDIRSDLYSFNMSFVYRFKNNNPKYILPVYEAKEISSSIIVAEKPYTTPEVCVPKFLEHKVKAGDRLLELARRYDITLESFIILNNTPFHIVEHDRAQPKDVIFYYDNDKKVHKYEFKPGDTLINIARRYAVTLEHFILLNQGLFHVDNYDVIHPGDVLFYEESSCK